MRRIGRLLSRSMRKTANAWRQRIARKGHESFVVDVDCLLMGDECGLQANKVATIFDEPLRPSTRMCDSPHATLLEKYKQLGESLFDLEVLRQTPYYKNAFLNIDIFGHYFGAKSEEAIPQLIRDFVDQWRGKSIERVTQPGQSPLGAPVLVRPIKHSKMFQLIDGHHRVASAIASGKSRLPVVSTQEGVLTPIQERLLDVLWLNGRRELYQPIDLPEVQEEWTLVRRCTDRLAKMLDFLEGQPDTVGGSHLDLGCSYGWFVWQMSQRGFRSHGVERDPIAASIGRDVYGLSSDSISRSDVVRFLRESTSPYDFVSCFSILHHFHLSDQGTSPDDVLRLLDKVTARCLFFDMAHCGEKWFREQLSGWDHDAIEQWLRSNTSFRKVVRLGCDEDAVPPFQDNYSRMLFACVR
ncbi:MAG: methyltransferase domain-containing protein [Pirellulales bacterium]|nr:methyltransferase domain-containing protein [Pirellulales bacterium]